MQYIFRRIKLGGKDEREMMKNECTYEIYGVKKTCSFSYNILLTA